MSYHYHVKRTEIWTITRGTGQCMLDGKLCRLKPGDVLSVPPRKLHAIMAQTDLELIEVQMGAELVEEDIIRISLP